MNTTQNDQELLTKHNHPDEVVMEEKASSLTQGWGGTFFEGGYPQRWPYSKNAQAKQGEKNEHNSK